MSIYLLINILIIIIPLLLSFDKKVRFYRKIPAVLVSIISVGIIFITWDIYAAGKGHWSFNKAYTSEVGLLGLPIEEVLFFITVPYAMIFTYEVINYYLKDKVSYRPDIHKYFLILSAIIFTIAFFNFEQAYTFLALAFCAAFFLVAFYFYTDLMEKGIFWFFMLFSFIPFITVNYFLTSLPVVIYNPVSIWGTRFLTIPLEDFFYSFSLISFYILVYTVSLKKMRIA